MARLTEDFGHFAPFDLVLVLSSSDSIRDVFSELSKRPGNGGGLMVKAATGDQFVKSLSLAKAVMNLASISPAGATQNWADDKELYDANWEKILDQSIADILPEAQTILDQWNMPGVLKLEPRNSKTDPSDLLKDTNHRAIAVQVEGQTVGLFLNHETIFGVLNSNPPVWYCEDDHPNGDPDHGFCSQCPLRLKDVK